MDCIGQLILDAGVLVGETTEEPTHWNPTALAYHQLARGGSLIVDGALLTNSDVPPRAPIRR